VSEKALAFVDDLVRDFGDEEVAQAIGAESIASGVDREFLSRVKTRCILKARLAEQARAERERQAEAEYQRKLKEEGERMTPEERQRAAEAKAQVEAFVRGLPS
jgi:hypothetical protein